MDTRNDNRRGLRLAASGGEAVLDGPLFALEPAPLNALELLDAESRLLAQAVGEHLPLELALQVDVLRAQRAALGR